MQQIVEAFARAAGVEKTGKAEGKYDLWPLCRTWKAQMTGRPSKKQERLTRENGPHIWYLCATADRRALTHNERCQRSATRRGPSRRGNWHSRRASW
jgi:hypothetical protein